MSRDNLSPTHSLTPRLARLRKAPDDTVTTETSAADNTDGFTRNVVLSQVMDEPGKGANAPRREIRTRLHHDDAFTLGIQLLKDAVATEARVLTEGKGGLRPRFWHRVFGSPSRRMPLYMARDTEQGIKAILARMELLEQCEPNVADYRINNVIHHLRAALRNAEYLTQDTTPDLDLARQQLVASGFFKDDEPADDTPEPGALTGHAATDARSLTEQCVQAGTDWPSKAERDEMNRRHVPRLLARGKYYVTTTTAVPVRVQAISTHHIYLTVLGEHAAEYKDGIKADRSEARVWLILDDEGDWVPTTDEAEQPDGN